MSPRPHLYNPDPAGPKDRVLRDRALMTRVQAGEPEAFEELVHCYWAPLVRYLRRLVGDLDEAQDVVQEAFVRLWARRLDWEPSPTGTVQSYLYLLARRVAIDELRRRRTRKAWAQLASGSKLAPPPTPVQLFDRARLAEALERAIQALPERRREVFILANQHDLSYADIAEVMGISIKTVANQMWAAVGELRERLRKEELAP